MRRVLLALPLTLAVASIAAASDPAAPATKPPPARLLHEVTYTTTVPTPPAGTKKVEVWLPVPFEDDTQRVLCLSVASRRALCALPLDFLDAPGLLPAEFAFAHLGIIGMWPWPVEAICYTAASRALREIPA